MYSFKNDYSEGMHPAILDALTKTNTQQTEGYTEDIYSRDAVTLIEKAMNYTQKEELS